MATITEGGLIVARGEEALDLWENALYESLAQEREFVLYWAGWGFRLQGFIAGVGLCAAVYWLL